MQFVPVFNHLTSDINVCVTCRGKTLCGTSVCALGSDFIPARHIKPGNSLNVYVNGLPFIEYTLIKCNKALHIGGITSRWVGADQDSNIIPANAQQGRPYIRIHNFTSCELNLNEEFIIPPTSTRHFKGRDHLGVRLGTVLVDNGGNFGKWKMMVPITDVYFGVISEVEQPGYGGWQMDEVFNEHFNEPNFLLQEGFLSGPAIHHINYNALPPVEGCFEKCVDDWGLPL